MSFSIIIATCDRPELLQTTLTFVNSAIEQSLKQNEIIVVDNGSRAQARDTVFEFSKKATCNVVYLQSVPGNKAVALNKGIKKARYEWLAFTDDDVLPSPTWLKEANSYLNENDVKLFGGRIVPGAINDSLPKWLRSQHAVNLLRGPAVVIYQPLKESGVISSFAPVPLGANLFVNKIVFEMYGDYNENLWNACGKAALGCEDAEFGIRVRRSGEKIGYCSRAVVVHPVSSQRCTFSHHIRWAYREGVRERILFSRFGDKPSFLYCLKSVIRSFLYAIMSILSGDTTMFVKHCMGIASIIAQMRLLLGFVIDILYFRIEK